MDRKLIIFSGILLAFLYASELSRFDSTFGDVDIPLNDDSQFDSLPTNLQQWFHKGEFVSVNNINMYIQKIPYSPKSEKKVSSPTFILIHGFPTSSFDYHDVINGLSVQGSVLVFDHVGFGFSDKPTTGFSYSIMDHADQALSLWQLLGVTSAHLIAHDMGDSVLTEIIYRWKKRLLPDYFKNFFKSITFTNGGMLVEHIDFRLSQRLLLHPLVGPIASRLSGLPIFDWFASKQLASIWSSSADVEKRDEEIRNIQALNRYRHGNRLMHKTVSYIVDRYRHQPRWISTLASINGLPCSFVWGDKDAVSPLAMMTSLSGLVPQCRALLLPGLGHFTMLESPETWLRHVVPKTL